jgi:L-threonylcarbamoyladenylate synthase
VVSVFGEENPMDTLVLPAFSEETLAAALEGAAAVLRAGDPVALPTETVYGLGADALRADAVLKIFEAKARPFFDPLIVHLPDLGWLEQLTEISPATRPLVEALAARFWPGPLTLVLPRRTRVPDLVASGLETVAVRISAHPVFAAVVGRFGRPIAAPSANRFGRISPTTAAHVQSELAGRIGLIVDGGPAIHGVESTIVAVESNALRILRSGPVTREDLAPFAPVYEAAFGAKLQAPGQIKSHYAPRTPLHLLTDGAPAPEPCTRLGWLGYRSGPEGFGRVEVLSAAGDFREAAATLFAKMRRLDEAGLDAIFAESVPEEGLGIAIMDRLRRAAHREQG